MQVFLVTEVVTEIEARGRLTGVGAKAPGPAVAVDQVVSSESAHRVPTVSPNEENRHQSCRLSTPVENWPGGAGRKLSTS